MREPKFLSLADSFKLMNLLSTEYVLSGKDDSDFAIYASEKLSIKVNKDHIRNRRASLEIPNNRRVAAAEKRVKRGGKIIDRIKALETALLELVARVQHLEKPFSTHSKG